MFCIWGYSYTHFVLLFATYCLYLWLRLAYSVGIYITWCNNDCQIIPFSNPHMGWTVSGARQRAQRRVFVFAQVDVCDATSSSASASSLPPRVLLGRGQCWNRLAMRESVSTKEFGDMPWVKRISHVVSVILGFSFCYSSFHGSPKIRFGAAEQTVQ